jgi:hypothetical protein
VNDIWLDGKTILFFPAKEIETFEITKSTSLPILLTYLEYRDSRKIRKTAANHPTSFLNRVIR